MDPDWARVLKFSVNADPNEVMLPLLVKNGAIGSIACSGWALISVVMPKNSATESIKAKPVPVEALAVRASIRPKRTAAAAFRVTVRRVGFLLVNIVYYFC